MFIVSLQYKQMNEKNVMAISVSGTKVFCVLVLVCFKERHHKDMEDIFLMLLLPTTNFWVISD